MTSSLCSVDPGKLEQDVHSAFSMLEQIRFVDALWSRRVEDWSNDSDIKTQISNRLGWLSVVDWIRPQVQKIERLAKQIQTKDFSDIVLLGMGGSSLSAEVMCRIIDRPKEAPRFLMLDSVDPVEIRRALEKTSTSLFIISSKSGTTIETNLIAAEVRRRLEAEGCTDLGSRFIAITDENTDLHRYAVDQRFREIFINPSDVGGRYSALSFFGLVPAGLLGMPLETLLDQAVLMATACKNEKPQHNPGLTLGVFIAVAAKAGRDKLTLILPKRLASLSLWIEQLIAESTGKQDTGIVPITSESLLPHYGTDRSAVVIELLGQETDPGIIARLKTTSCPLLTIQMPDTNALGGEFFRWEIAAATAGFLLGVNPFNEPNVQQSKKTTQKLLDIYDASGQLPLTEPDTITKGANFLLSDNARQQLKKKEPRHFLELLTTDDYLGLLAYLPTSEIKIEEILKKFCIAVSCIAGHATTLGYGPRYLHSTGQLHKGGRRNGLFIVITAKPENDLSIPNKSYSFGILQQAQAIGDFVSLEEGQRRALLIQLPTRDPDVLNDALTNLLPKALTKSYQTES